MLSIFTINNQKKKDQGLFYIARAHSGYYFIARTHSGLNIMFRKTGCGHQVYERGNWRAASPPLSKFYMKSSTLSLYYYLLPDTKKINTEKKISLKNMYCHVFSCRFLISFTPAFSIFHVIWQWSWVCTISWVAELSIYTFAYFPYIILPFFKIMILFYFMFLYYFSIIITLF